MNNNLKNVQEHLMRVYILYYQEQDDREKISWHIASISKFQFVSQIF